MHEPILDGLEEYLSGRLPSEKQAQFVAHLERCSACREQVELFSEHAGLMRTLRAPEQVDPAPGFYSRVLDRIEAESAPSLWSVFLEPAFGGRLMAATFALFLLLAGAAWQSPGSVVLEEHNPMTVLAASEMPPASGEDLERDRNTVFVNLATYGGGGNAVSLLPVSSD